ncbi:MAG: hypothetical protein LBP60_06755 [Spirochaetaceae bacterium]|nr:hypothetical protein [Spirochaetaceae bacterium]
MKVIRKTLTALQLISMRIPQTVTSGFREPGFEKICQVDVFFTIVDIVYHGGL